ESKIVLFNLDSSNSSKNPEILDDSISFNKSELAVNMAVKNSGEDHYVYVLTVDLTSHEDGGFFEKRGRIICYQLIQSSAGSLSKFKHSNNNLETINSNQVSLVQKSQYSVEDGALC